MNESPDFRSQDFLREHIAHTMAFYHPRALDPEGGFFQYFKDDGTVYDKGHRHLVSSTRFVFNYAMAYHEFGNSEYLEAVHHGVEYLRNVHRDARSGGYAWTIRDGHAEDRTNHCYGVAFVLLAYSCAHQVGVPEAADWMDETWDLLEKHFWEAKAGLYRDEASSDWVFTDYRGQNANMHMCEAMLTAFEASGDARYLERAYTLADHMTRRQAGNAGEMVWEHYDRNWQPDWGYNRSNPTHLFRPWGFQAGHQTEWAKLLLILERHRPEAWLLPRARELFEAALTRAWDTEYGGIYYGLAPDGTPCDTDKYFWVQAESLAAAALLAARSGERTYWNWYGAIWSYAWKHFVDHRYGGWYRILDRGNRKYSDEKSPAGKVDYHTMGACYEVLKLLREQTNREPK